MKIDAEFERRLEAEVEAMWEDGSYFRSEYEESVSAEFPLLDLLAVEDEAGPDLAFLRVGGGADLPLPAILGGSLEAEEAVAVIGYTSREPGTPPAMVTGLHGPSHRP